MFETPFHLSVSPKYGIKIHNFNLITFFYEENIWNLYCTFLCGEHSCNSAERSFSAVVEGSHFDVERWERRDGVIAENIAGDTGCWNHDPGPSHHSHWPESNDITKALSVLQLLWNRLRVEHKTIVILKQIEVNKPTDPHDNRALLALSRKSSFSLKTFFLLLCMPFYGIKLVESIL